MKRLFLFITTVIWFTACSSTRPVPVVELPETDFVAISDTQAPAFSTVPIVPVPSGRFDNGKMWTFENPPFDYFREAYGFEPDQDWFTHARLGSVRLTNCSGSLVSPNGLILTNHHCVREMVSRVSLEGESLLDSGYLAQRLEDERKIPDTYIDQLIEIRDITDRVNEDVDPTAPSDMQETIRNENLAAIGEEIELEFSDDDMEVQLVSLYSGGRYSAYVFRRYRDIRLVMAPELAIGYFGGDPDNFTYPRYNLDMAFLRLYRDDKPLETPVYFPWSTAGVSEGDVVFMIGNPGSTTRLQTVEQLLYRGAYADRFMLALYRSFIASFEAYLAHDPAEAEARDMRNTLFGFKNVEKLLTGQVAAITDPAILGRRLDMQQGFREKLAQDEALGAQYLQLFDEIRSIQEKKAAIAAPYYSFLAVYPGSPYAPVALQRAFFGYLYGFYKGMGVPAEHIEGLRDQLLGLEIPSEFYDRQLMTDRLELVVSNYGGDHPVIKQLLKGADIPAYVAALYDSSRVADAEAFAELLFNGRLTKDDDMAFAMAALFVEDMLDAQETYSALTDQEERLQGQLGAALYALYGATMPPDATFSLRLSDGVVNGYTYNGTRAPVFTTFYGLYDRSYSHQGVEPWNLPPRWSKPSSTMNLATPLNFVSTNDIIGGNSGSPVLNLQLELVGLAFDSNIEGMGTGDFIYTDEVARAVNVDARGMLEALRHVYKADRLVRELMGR